MKRRFLGLLTTFSFLSTIVGIIPTANSYETVAQLSSAQGVLNVDFGTLSPLRCKGLESDKYACTYSTVVFFNAKKTNGDWFLLDSERKIFAESLDRFQLVLVEFDGKSVSPAISSQYAEIKLDLSNLPMTGGKANVWVSAITNSPEKLRPWILPVKEGSRVSKLPVLDVSDSINIQFDAATITKNEEKSRTGLNFYPNVGLDGEWLDPSNRDENGECEFGFDGILSDITCEKIIWEEDSENDGFTKTLSISIDNSNDKYDTGDYSNLIIECSNKILRVGAYFKYADSIGWKGSGQYRFDSGSPKKFTYELSRSFRYFWMDNPKLFTSGLLKSKTKLTLKVANDYVRILAFPKSDLNNWTSKFKSAGCPLK